MNSTRRGFLIRGAAVGGAALVRRVLTALARRSTAAYAVVGGMRPTRSAITHGPFVGHLTIKSRHAGEPDNDSGYPCLPPRPLSTCETEGHVASHEAEWMASRPAGQTDGNPKPFWGRKTG